jgi:hypothetical protein
VKDNAQEAIPMRKLFAALTMAAMLALSAAPATADTLVGVNVCDVSVLVENDDAATDQCHNE